MGGSQKKGFLRKILFLENNLRISLFKTRFKVAVGYWLGWSPNILVLISWSRYLKSVLDDTQNILN